MSSPTSVGSAAAVHGAVELHLSQHHLRMMGEVFIHLDGAVFGVDGLKLAPGMARGHALPGARLRRKRMSVVTSVPALALKAVLGRRMAPIRSALSARVARMVSSCLSIV